MLCLVSLNKRRRLPRLFVAFWSVAIVVLTGYLSERVKLTWWTPEGSERGQFVEALQSQEPPGIDDASYAAIEMGMPAYRLSSILGQWSFMGNEQALRSLPGHEDADPGQRVTWMVFLSSKSPDQWIQVGIAWSYQPLHVPAVVAKRKHGF